MRNQISTRVSHLTALAVGLLAVAASHRAWADDVSRSHAEGAQLCALGFSAVGQPGTVICKDVTTGTTTQSVAVGATLSSAGGISGSLVRHGRHVLVTNQAQGAMLFDLIGGQLQSPRTLQIEGEGSLSGALSDQGAYVLTGTRLLFFPRGESTATSTQPLLVADGSAAHVVLAGGLAYVSEKNGSLEAFPLRRDGNLRGNAAPVDGIPAGAIVGITAAGDTVVAPVAHLASNFDQSIIPVVRRLTVAQTVATKEMAACWAANEDGEVCVTNPGSMTVSCGRLGHRGFTSYTSAAATLVGETVFDIDMMNGLVGILGRSKGAPVLLTYSRTREGGDFLSPISELPFEASMASGALLLPSP